MSAYDDLALSYDCPACKAPAGEWCRTYRPTSRPAGQRATWLHGPRITPIYLAFGDGYQEGVDDGMHAALEDPEWAQKQLAKKGKA